MYCIMITIIKFNMIILSTLLNNQFYYCNNIRNIATNKIIETIYFNINYYISCYAKTNIICTISFISSVSSVQNYQKRLY